MVAGQASRLLCVAVLSFFLFLLPSSPSQIQSVCCPLRCFQTGGPPPLVSICSRAPLSSRPQQQQQQQQQQRSAAAQGLGLFKMAVGAARGHLLLRASVGPLVRVSLSGGPQRGPPRGASTSNSTPALFIRRLASQSAALRAAASAASSPQAATAQLAPAAAAAAATATAAASAAAEATPLRRVFTRTKQVATIGPASWEKHQIETLYLSGVDVFRLNLSHGLLSEKHQQYNHIREIEKKYNKPIAVLADLPGPKLRLGLLDPEEVTLQQGDEFVLDAKEEEPGGPSRAPLQQKEVLGALKLGDVVLIDDGKVKLRVAQLSPAHPHQQQQQQQQRQQGQREKEGEEGEGLWVRCVVEEGGLIASKKGVAVPNTVVPISALTDRDKEIAALVSSWGVDYIAVSFVQEAADLEALRALLHRTNSPGGDGGAPDGGPSSRAAGAEGPPLLIAKIERLQALRQLDAIAAAADGLMVARGDLGLELGPESVPRAQKEILEAARRHRKPLIVATQMLETMMHNPLPSRAEAADVAAAVFDGADAVMLSGETAAAAKGPSIVNMQQRLIKQTEEDPRLWRLGALRSTQAARVFAAAAAAATAFSPGPHQLRPAWGPLWGPPGGGWEAREEEEASKQEEGATQGPALVAEGVAEAADVLSRATQAAAIAVLTETGDEPATLSFLRPRAPIFAFTKNVRAARKLQLYWGVQTLFLGAPLGAPSEGAPAAGGQGAPAAAGNAAAAAEGWLEAAKREVREEGFARGPSSLLVVVEGTQQQGGAPGGHATDAAAQTTHSIRYCPGGSLRLNQPLEGLGGHSGAAALLAGS
ncbi:hypothetical protein Efla_004115 [Eimeria flavescens]